MAITDENGAGMVMPVAPMGGYGNGGFGGGMFDGNGWWILLLFILLGNGAWGNGFGGFCGGNAMADMYPWMNQQNQINDGFRDQMLNTQVNSIQNGITSGFGDVQNALCSGFAGVTAAVTAAQNANAQQMYANQIADMERSYAAQTAQTAGMTALQAQLAQCCCDNRAATADLKYTVATEACADRAAVSDALNSTLNAMNAGIQSIKDQMCQDKIDAKNERIAELQQQVNMQNLAASQAAQTAQLLADNARQTQDVENYIRPQINPAYVVPNPYAYNFMPNQGWNSCNTGCGCGM